MSAEGTGHRDDEPFPLACIAAFRETGSTDEQVPAPLIQPSPLELAPVQGKQQTDGVLRAVEREAHVERPRFEHDRCSGVECDHIGATPLEIHGRDETAIEAEGVGTILMTVARRSEEHTSELQSRGHLVCRLLLEKKKTKERRASYPTTKKTEKTSIRRTTRTTIARRTARE